MMTLVPGIGLGPIRFGMTRAAIVALLGPPDLERPSDDSDDEDRRTALIYHSLKTRLEIYENHGGRLGYIRTKNPALTYNGHRLIGQPLREVQGVFADLIQEWEVEEYDFFIIHFNMDWWIDLKSDYGVLESLDMGVPFKNDDEYNWPDAVPNAVSDALAGSAAPPDRK